MDIVQRYVIAFFHRQQMSAQDIQTKLAEVYGSQAYQIGSVTYWIRQIILGRENLHDEPKREKPIDESITIAVQAQIEQNPLMSARQIAKVLNISPTTVVYRLSNILHYKCLHTMWVPHHLSAIQKKNRTDIAKSMLPLLVNEKRTHFANIYTGDESWFLFEYTQNTQWVISKENLIEKVRKTNFEKKIMLTVFFNGLGPTVINFLPINMKFNGSYFIDIIEEIKNKVYPNGRPFRTARKILYIDNSPCHRSQKVKTYIENCEFRTMKHPAFSPDVAPSDFGLFGTFKDKLAGVSHETIEDLQEHIIQILTDFDQEFWESLFNQWITRLEKLIEVKGDYV